VIKGHEGLVDVENVGVFDILRCRLGNPGFNSGSSFLGWQFFSFLLFQNRYGTANHWDYYVLWYRGETDKKTTILENVFLFLQILKKRFHGLKHR
jgi:hypothetical protein